MVEYLKTKADFDAAISGAGDKTVIVDFTASWCPPCKMIAPFFEQLSKDFANVLAYKVDVDENEETAAANGIEAMPTFIVFKGGEVVEKLRGADKDGLKQRFEQHN